MDPTANLERQIEIAREIQRLEESGEGWSDLLAVELSDLVIALADWIAADGFPPTPWIASFRRPTGLARARNPRPPLLDSLALVRATAVKARLMKEHKK